MNIPFLGDLLGKGPLNTLFIDIALGLLVVAIGIWVMEFSGWTVSVRGFKRNGVVWGSRSIALVAVCAALYIAGRPLQLQLIPGIGGINPSFSLAPVLVALFGLPGAVGVTFSMPIGDAISGALTLGSVAGCLGHTFVTWMVYKFCRDASMRTVRSWVGLYLGIVVGAGLHAIVVPGWLDFTHVTPPAIAWGAVTVSIIINQVLTPAVVAPILLYTLYPSVKQSGMYWRDTLSAGSLVAGRLAAMRAAISAVPLPSLAVNGPVPAPAVNGTASLDVNGAASLDVNGAASLDVNGAPSLDVNEAPYLTVGEAPSPGANGTGAPPVIDVRDLWLAYPSADQPSLCGVSLRAGPGEFIGVTGPSGAGKSTLLACLAGLVPRSLTAEASGTVRILGRDVLAGPLGMDGSRVGLVLQDAEAQIVGMTVAEDLAFGPENYGLDPAEIRRRSTRVLAEVGLAGMVGRDTYALSGGQKQRLAIASALMMEPDLILLDEPTSELDPMGKAEVFEVVDRLRRQSSATIVMVEHELDRLAGMADRLIVLDQGRVTAEGAPADLLSDIEIFLRTGGERPPAAAELQWRLRTAGLPMGTETSLSLPVVVSRIQALTGETA